jgi:hypothetical protein
MKKSVTDFAARLTSRKFLLTIGGIFLGAVYPAHANDIITLIAIYVGGEGAADAVSRFSDAKYRKVVQDAQTLLGDLDDEIQPDKSRVVPGAAAPDPVIGATAVYPPTP